MLTFADALRQITVRLKPDTTYSFNGRTKEEEEQRVMKQRFTIGSVGAVIAAIWLASAHVATQGAQGRQDQGSSGVTTPHGQDGHPDFSGIWVPTRNRGEAPPPGFDPSTGNFNPVLRSRTNSPVDFERDAGIR